MESTKRLTFKVVRKNPEVIAPAKPTPHEFKFLSDIDDQEGLRFQVPVIQIYRRNPSVEGRDPAKVIRDAIAKALVFYYPLAGRLREGDGRKLLVECTGEGVIFIEADADVTLHQFGDTLHPPIPCLQELLYHVPGSGQTLHSPLMLIQVTRLKCGGFIFAMRHNHTMNDAAGVVQFMTAVGELARGAEAPSVTPIWGRSQVSARNPPRVTCTHPQYDDVVQDMTAPAPVPVDEDEDDMVLRSFFFGTAEFSALRSRLPPHLQGCSNFELLTACMWRCRTKAISPEPNEEVRVLFAVNFRRLLNPPLPEGYYGNAIVSTAGIASAGELLKNPMHYAVEVVRKTKAEVTEEYIKSVADLMVIRGRPGFNIVRTYMVSDLTRAGFDLVDYGWGMPVYGGPADSGGVIADMLSFYVRFENNKGEKGILVPISLPANAMKVFVEELDSMLKAGGNAAADHRKTDNKSNHLLHHLPSAL